MSWDLRCCYRAYNGERANILHNIVFTEFARIQSSWTLASGRMGVPRKSHKLDFLNRTLQSDLNVGAGFCEGEMLTLI